MFVKINVIKYQGNQGSVVQLPVWINMYSVSYIDVSDPKKLVVHMAGETGSGLYVTDEESINVLMSAVR